MTAAIWAGTLGRHWQHCGQKARSAIALGQVLGIGGIGLRLAMPNLFDPRCKAWMSRKSPLQSRQFLPEERQRKNSFHVGLPDLPGRLARRQTRSASQSQMSTLSTHLSASDARALSRRAHIVCILIFFDLSVHTSRTRRLLTG
jgi:hypothetical protein